jgi:hypothetical protein
MAFQSTIFGEYKFECSSVEGGGNSSNNESGNDGNGNEDVLEEVGQHTDKRACFCDQNLESVAQGNMETGVPFDGDNITLLNEADEEIMPPGMMMMIIQIIMALMEVMGRKMESPALGQAALIPFVAGTSTLCT